MNEFELRKILRQPEGPKLEFKQSFYQINASDPGLRNREWGELVKDILALANGNIGFASQKGYLIIGVSESLDSSGNRSLHSCEQVTIDKQQILRKVNGYCNPPLSNIDIDHIDIDNCEIIVITIPVTYDLHETIKDLQTKSRVFPERVAFIRRGDDVCNASQQERDGILEDKKSARRVFSIQSELDELIMKRDELIYKGDRCSAEFKSLSVRINYLEDKMAIRGKEPNGKRFIRHARKIMNEPSINKEIDEMEIYDEVLWSLKRAVNVGEKNSWVYYQIVRLLDKSELLLDAYNWGCEAIESECIAENLHRLHLKICISVRELYPDYLDDAEKYIVYHKQRLCQILNVKSVNDWGEPE